MTRVIRWHDCKTSILYRLMRPVYEGIKKGILLSMGSANFSTVNMYYSCGSHVAAWWTVQEYRWVHLDVKGRLVHPSVSPFLSGKA